jgi:hypothetical protein
MLSVDGTVIAEKVIVSVSEWADNVFAQNYKLMPLDKLNEYITNNGKLPDIPSESEVKKDGVDLGALNVKLLKKIEELTRYVIELKKENQEIKSQLREIKK